MPVLKELFIILLVAILFVVGFSSYVSFIYIKPRRYVSMATPATFNLKPFEDVTLKTEDGITLKGWYITAQQPIDKAIIICHGYPMDKGNVLSFGSMLHKDYNLLFFDFRGMGESGGKITTLGFKETKDLNAAVSFLKDKGIKSIGVLGLSLGGAVAIMANNPDISAIVSESAYARLDMMVESVYNNFRFMKGPFVYFTKLIASLALGIDTSQVSPAKEAGKLKSALLLIHSGKDTQIDMRQAYLLHKAAPNSELWIAPLADHGEIYYTYQDEYIKRVTSFFEKHLR